VRHVEQRGRRHVHAQDLRADGLQLRTGRRRVRRASGLRQVRDGLLWRWRQAQRVFDRANRMCTEDVRRSRRQLWPSVRWMRRAHVELRRVFV
jgi:hypothetical protein